MSALARTVARIEHWIYAPASATRLVAIRVGLCLVLAARLSRPLYLGLSGQPALLYRPLSFMRLFSGMPGWGLVLTLQITGVTAALAAAAGLRTRYSLPAAWLCGLYLNGMWASIGKVMHNDVLLLLAMVPFLFAPVDVPRLFRRPISQVASRESWRFGWPVRLSMLVVAGGYFFTGFNKLVFSGPAWVTSQNMRWIMYGISDGNSHPIAPALFIANNPLIAHAVAAASLTVELSFPVLLWKPRLAWLLLPAVVALHIGIGITMHLDYSAWAATAVIVFVPWDRVKPLRRSTRVEELPGNLASIVAPSTAPAGRQARVS
jgi:hypothetical protein